MSSLLSSLFGGGRSKDRSSSIASGGDSMSASAQNENELLSSSGMSNMEPNSSTFSINEIAFERQIDSKSSEEIEVVDDQEVIIEEDVVDE